MEEVKALAGGSWSLMTTCVQPTRPTTSAWASSWNAPIPGPHAPRGTLSSPVPPVPPPAPQTIEPIAPPDVSTILDELVTSVGGVHSAILASVDGFGIARSSSMSDEASYPAMLAAAIGLGHQLVTMGGGVRLRQLVIDHDGGLMLVWPIGEQRVLAVLTSASVEQRRVRSFVQARAAGLVGATT